MSGLLKEPLFTRLLMEATTLLLLSLAARYALGRARRDGNPAAGPEEQAEFRRRRWWWLENRACFLFLMAGRVLQFFFPEHVHVSVAGVFLSKLLFWWKDVTSPLLRDTLQLPLTKVPYPRDGPLARGYLRTADPLFAVGVSWLCSVPSALFVLFSLFILSSFFSAVPTLIALDIVAQMMDYALLIAYFYECATGELRPPNYHLTEEERLMTSTYHVLDHHPVGLTGFPSGEPRYLFGLPEDTGHEQEGEQPSWCKAHLVSGFSCLLLGPLLGRSLVLLAPVGFLVTRLAVCGFREWRASTGRQTA